MPLHQAMSEALLLTRAEKQDECCCLLLLLLAGFKVGVVGRTGAGKSRWVTT
jgi:ABC-type multidrug transport system fused ATPase/permease subunit